MTRVLFVDDDQRFLDVIQNRLHDHRAEWSMTFALGSRAALAEVEKSPFDVVISDFRMSGMDGGALLTRVKEQQPSAVRIILSAPAERDDAIRLIPVAHQFLSKPCDPVVLQNVIHRVCGLQRVLHDKAISDLVGTIDKLPSVSDTYWELTRALAREESSADIARIIERDPAMCAKLLQIVNSAFFGLARCIISVEEATVYLGIEVLRVLTLQAQVFAAVQTMAVEGFSLEREQEHSLQTAKLARQLLGSSPHAGEAFTAGLLHDIGRILLAFGAPDRFGQVDSEVRRSGRADHVVEKELLGITHAEIGGYLLGAWGLPLSIVEAVAFHHHPGLCVNGNPEILAAVHVAEAFVDGGGQPVGAGAFEGQLDLSFLSHAGFKNKLPSWRARATAQVARMAK